MAQRKQPSPAQPAVCVVFGTEQFLKDQAVGRIRQATIGVAADSLAYSEFDATAELSEVLDELRTLPMLGDRRLVVVADADDFVSRHREPLQRYCESPSASAWLLLVCRTFDRRTRLYRTVAAEGQIIACDPLKRHQVAGWIRNHAREAHGCTMDDRAAAFLQQLIGDELSALDGELAKLATYVDDRRRIRQEDIRALCGFSREEKIFGVGDAITGRDVRGALAFWDQVWKTDRAAAGRAVGGLAWALRRHLDGKCQLERGESVSRLARQLWRDPGEVKRMMDGNSLWRMEQNLCDLARADVDIKTGRGQPRSVIEQFIVACTTGDPAR